MSHASIAEKLTLADLESVEFARAMSGRSPSHRIICLCGCGQFVTYENRTVVRIPGKNAQIWRKECAAPRSQTG